MGRAMIDLYCESFRQVPKRIILDIDDTFDAVHGGQQLRLFNAHYDEYGFQPIVAFDGDGCFITAVAARVVEMKTMIRIHPPTACPAQDICLSCSGVSRASST